MGEDYFPLMHGFIREADDAWVDSEYLFIDRYVALLKAGGSALVVVPDGVVSAKGLAEMVRERVSATCTLKSVTELPPVTFAQAGTRTRTCVLHFQKGRVESPSSVFFGVAKAVGFEVKSRKGVPVKLPVGTNDLDALFKAYTAFHNGRRYRTPRVYSTSPSGVGVPWDNTDEPGWTPSHYAARRYAALESLSSLATQGSTELKVLKDLVSFPNKKRGDLRVEGDTRCISVLHVGNFGFLNVDEVMTYRPKCPGQPCRPGDILFSKINPRIPRVLVVPDLGCDLICSTEFEVMRANPHFSPFAIMMLLLTPVVQAQIQSLTSGTSSSHNRIRAEQLEEIVLPFPARTSRREFAAVVGRFESAAAGLNRCSAELYACTQQLAELWSV